MKPGHIKVVVSVRCNDMVEAREIGIDMRGFTPEQVRFYKKFQKGTAEFAGLERARRIRISRDRRRNAIREAAGQLALEIIAAIEREEGWA